MSSISLFIKTDFFASVNPGRNVKISAELFQTTKFTKNTKEQPVENKNKFFVTPFPRALCVFRGD